MKNMKKIISYNYHTYTAVDDKTISVSIDGKEYILNLKKPLKKGDMIKIVPVVDELLSLEVLSLRAQNL